MAHADPALFMSRSPVKFTGKSMFPVSLMAISIQESSLWTPGLFGNSLTIPVYKVTGHPFTQEWRRDVSIWCSLLGFEEEMEVAGLVSPLGVTFQTKTPLKAGNASQCSSPFFLQDFSSILRVVVFAILRYN